MARIRTIKPNFFKSEDLSSLDAETQLLAAGLLCYADDEGFFNANPKLVKAEIFPLRETSRTIHDMLIDLCNVGYLCIGTCENGRLYGHVCHFLDHQVINRPKPSEISKLNISWNNHGSITESSSQNNVGREGNKEGKGTTKGSEKSSRRRSRKQILEPYSEEVTKTVNSLIDIWPTNQPGDHKPIQIDTAQLAEKIDGLIRDGSSIESLIGSAQKYLSSGKHFVKAPQWFFGAGNGEAAHWTTYARMTVHEQAKEGGHADTLLS